MKRVIFTCTLAVPLTALLSVSLAADVRTRERTTIKFEGMLGRVVGLFGGGKAAKEGIVSTSAVKGERKATMSDTAGQIIDLGEEKVYDLDLRKKEYRVTTFDELRRRMKEAREKAEKEAAKEDPAEQQKADPGREWEVDFKVDETGQRRQIAGYDARQVIMTVTLREKGKALDDSGGFVMTSDSWFGPEIDALKEMAAFDMRYYKQLYGEEAFGLSADQMAMVMAMYPMLKKASERLQSEAEKLKGTALAMTTSFEAVRSKAEMTEQANQGGSAGGGIGGMLARRVMKKEEPKQRATIFTTGYELQEVSTSVDAADVAIPAGFKEKK
ncbi:MAG TPA: hypothetical protein VM364_10485 [Vicinamibacterales bacterium]|nr:hypothetical protein [Vicinamibacterales bacterium]